MALANNDTDFSTLVWQQLSAVVGEENVVMDENSAPDPCIRIYWNLRPGAYFTPTSAEDALQILALCHEQSIPCALRSFDSHSYVGQSTTDPRGPWSFP
jgi:FAD/FMN-containing dehydrogenase